MVSSIQWVIDAHELQKKRDAQADLFETCILPLFEQHRGDWLETARAVARDLGAHGRSVNIDDVRGVCPPPEGADPRVMGAVFRRSEWKSVGYVKSNRSACHGRPIQSFKLKEYCA